MSVITKLDGTFTKVFA